MLGGSVGVKEGQVGSREVIGCSRRGQGCRGVLLGSCEIKGGYRVFRLRSEVLSVHVGLKVFRERLEVDGGLSRRVRRSRDVNDY